MPARRNAGSARPPITIGNGVWTGSGPNTKSSIVWKRPRNGSVAPDHRCRHSRIVSSRYAPRTWKRSADGQVGEFGLVPADPDAGDDPAAAQRIERRELLGEDDRVALRDDDDARPEPDPRMARPDPGERQDRFVDAAVLAGIRMGDEDVIGRPDGGPAEPLGDARGGLDPVGRRTVREVRETQAEVHAADGTSRVAARVGQVAGPRGQP